MTDPAPLFTAPSTQPIILRHKTTLADGNPGEWVMCLGGHWTALPVGAERVACPDCEETT